MKKLQADRLTLHQIADRWAKETANESDNLTSDEILQEFVRSIFRGEFEDDSLAIARYPKGGAQRADGRFVDSSHEPTSEIRWLVLGRECILKMTRTRAGTGANFKNWTWDRLSTDLRLEDFEAQFREEYLEKLSITREAFGNWCDRRGHDHPAFWFPQEPELAPDGHRPLATAFLVYTEELARAKSVPEWKPDRIASRTGRSPQYSPDDSSQAKRWRTIMREAERNYLAELAGGRHIVTVFDDSLDRKGDIPQSVWRVSGIADLLYIDRISPLGLPKGCAEYFARFERCRLFVPEDGVRKAVAGETGTGQGRKTATKTQKTKIMARIANMVESGEILNERGAPSKWARLLKEDFEEYKPDTLRRYISAELKEKREREKKPETG